MYTGDDFNYPELIAGDDQGYSDALCSAIFDAIAPVASVALGALAAGDRARYDALFEPTVPLSRHVFAAPTRFIYKTGVVFLAWLNGHQDHFTMVGGQESARSTLHLADLFRLADRAGLLTDPDRAASRMDDADDPCGGSRRDRPPAPLTDLTRLSINTATTRAQWGLDQAIPAYAAAGVAGVAPWRDQVALTGLDRTAALIRDHGLTVTGLCRGGMFPAADAARRRAAIDDNRRAIDEAAALNAQCLVIVSGGLPEGSKDIAGARAMVAEGLAAILPWAREAGVPLAIEPLHPMYAADRCCVKRARPGARPLRRAGRRHRRGRRRLSRLGGIPACRRRSRGPAEDRLLAFHICDWLVPTATCCSTAG